MLVKLVQRMRYVGALDPNAVASERKNDLHRFIPDMQEIVTTATMLDLRKKHRMASLSTAVGEWRQLLSFKYSQAMTAQKIFLRCIGSALLTVTHLVFCWTPNVSEAVVLPLAGTNEQMWHRHLRCSSSTPICVGVRSVTCG